MHFSKSLKHVVLYCALDTATRMLALFCFGVFSEVRYNLIVKQCCCSCHCMLTYLPPLEVALPDGAVERGVAASIEFPPSRFAAPSLRRFPITFPPGRDPNSRLKKDSTRSLLAKRAPTPPPFRQSSSSAAAAASVCVRSLCVRRESRERARQRARAVLCNVLKDATVRDQESRNIKW